MDLLTLIPGAIGSLIFVVLIILVARKKSIKRRCFGCGLKIGKHDKAMISASGYRFHAGTCAGRIINGTA